MDAGLRNRANKRHDSDTAVLQQDRQSRSESEYEELKEELADKVDAWRMKVHQVRYRSCSSSGHDSGSQNGTYSISASSTQHVDSCSL